MYGLVVHGLPPPTMQRCSSSATHSEGQRPPQFFVLVFLDIQTGRPPGSRHESLPSHDVPGDFLFDARSTNFCPPRPEPRPLPHTTSGMAGAFLLANFVNLGAVHLTRAP